MAEINISAVRRDFKTKGERNQSRREGKIPGVFYVKGQEPVSILINSSDINPLVYTKENHIVSLTIDNEAPLSCVLKDTQFDAVTDKIIHFDFQGLTAGQEMEIEVPINFVGTAKGELDGGVVQYSIHKLLVSVLPKHMPESVEVDVSELEIGNSIFVRDLSYDNLTIISNEDNLVVSCNEPRAEEETEEKEEEETMDEPEVISKGKKEEE